MSEQQPMPITAWLVGSAVFLLFMLPRASWTELIGVGCLCLMFAGVMAVMFSPRG